MQLPVLVLAGPGNNGGDAIEAAALLAREQLPVQVLQLANTERLPADARAARLRAESSSVQFISTATLPPQCALVIDGLFGIGLTRPPDEPIRSLISTVNAMSAPVLSIDLPSGLDADTGAVVGDIAIRASDTLTFIGDKPGLHTSNGRDVSGRVSVDTLGIDASLYPPAIARLNAPQSFARVFRARAHASHKGTYGDLSILGGAAGMGGAVILAARMAAMAGAGRVFAGFAGPVPAFDPLHPEIMCRAAHTLPLTSGAVIAGPGLGQSDDGAGLLASAIASPLPLVLDADALNLIAADAGLQTRVSQRHAPTLLTPHPLEAGRLLGIDAAQVQRNRLEVAAALSTRYRAIAILKGSGTVVASADSAPVVNTTGNPALATAGSGDVLAGLCGALLAQRLSAWDAAVAAVWLHGAAADDLVASGTGPVGLTASELPAAIRRRINHLTAAPRP